MAGDNKPALVALRRRRDEVIERLSSHFASDALSLEEFEERLELAHQATALEHFKPLLADLEVTKEEPETSTALATVERPALPVTHETDDKKVTSILSSVHRKGQWRVPKKLRVLSVLGDAKIDFREVVLPAGVTRVNARSILGTVKIIVPPNLAVECEGSAILGEIEEMHRCPPERDPDAPLLLISARAVLGEFKIETRLPGESARGARKRLKKAAKQKRLTDGT